MPRNLLPSLLLTATFAGASDITVVVQADSGRRPISPWLYGRNNNLSDDPAEPTPDSVLAKYREAGLRMLRENGGNNATKYNWRRKLSSHPDWYNNVYAHDWDHAASTLQAKLPGTQGLFAFQLLGWAAANTTNNWGDWNWSQAHGGKYPNAGQDLAGGGLPDTIKLDTSRAAVLGDHTRYLEPWPADSSTGIVDHWFGAGGTALDSSRFRYWSMDNEPDIWSSTHDDATDTISFEAYFQKYLAVARSARRRMPSVKLVGPVIANEWMWWTWNNKAIDDDGTDRSPMEMFLKRVGEEERKSGTRLLDVFDLHFYPGYDNTGSVQNLLQTSRMFFDTAYAWPGSNGIHMHDGKWGKAVPNFLFERVRRWMVQYLGEERGISLTEFGAMSAGGDVDARDATYATWIGSFADHGGEILTAWDWYPGWWEVLHLFSRYAQPTRVASRSALDSVVSAYSSISSGGDSLTVVLVNRHTTAARSVTVRLRGFQPSGASAPTLLLSGLSGETFQSHAVNALKAGSAPITGDSVLVSIPAKGILALRLAGAGLPVTGVARKTILGGIRLRSTGSVLELEGTLAGAPWEIRTTAGRMLRRGTASEGRSTLPLDGLPGGLLVAHSGNWNRPFLHGR